MALDTFGQYVADREKHPDPISIGSAAVGSGTGNPNTNGSTSDFYNQFDADGNFVATWVRKPDGTYA